MATAISTVGPAEGRSAEWARKYPPLVAFAAAILIAVVVLPSSLNVPQSNPSTTLEFAPVPPKDDTPPPPANGNLGNLGLGSSGTLEEGGLPGGDDGGAGLDLPPPGTIPGGGGKSPRTKACVGNPPRQTEDPLSPPCVADFQGDNFGATYQGVTAEEVQVLFYLQGFYIYVNTCRDPGQETPDGTYFDLAKDPEGPEHCLIRNLRVWQQYFNERYQTYNRFVHFHVYVSGAGDSAEERKADAAENYAKIKPFAVVSTAEDFNDAYLQAMAKRGVLAFDATPFRAAEFFSQHPGRIWGYLPTQESTADMFVGMLCTKVVGKPVVSSGNPLDVGKDRKFGLVYTSDRGYPQLRRYKDLVVQRAQQRCGLKIDAEGTFPSAGYVQDNRYPPTYAQRVMADFKEKGITTIIWPGGLETNFSKAGAAIDYRPEVIISGDGLIENGGARTYQEQSFWDNVFVMTNIVRQDNPDDRECVTAYRSANPNGDNSDIETACLTYNSIRQLFTGIQVAGPKLTPTTMDQGYHAIPAVRSTDPRVPACYYEPGDYTCIKDAMLEKYDRTGGSNGNGCYRMVEGGLRYTARTWPEGNVNAQYDTADPCNTYSRSTSTNPNPPSPSNV